MRRKPHQLAGAIMRNLAALLTNTAQHLDPQPVHVTWPFTIHTSTTTRTAEARITWHETC